MKLTRRTFGAAAMAMGLSGCVSIPTTGPVEEVNRPADQTLLPGVQIAPDPPALGASPELILGGFLTACLSPANNYAVARDYLTPNAATQWNPNDGVTIYDGEGHPPVATATGASLRAPVLGFVSSDGFYTGAYKPDYQHDFGMTKAGHEWRISAPPAGLLISQYQFRRTFRAQQVYYLDRTGRYVVVEEVFLPLSTVSPTSAIQALLRGPSAWLRPALLHAIPADVKLSVPAVAVGDDGVADVSFTSPIESLSTDQRRQVSAQVQWTLASFPRISGVRISSGSTPLIFPGQDSRGVLRLTTVGGFQPYPSATSKQLYGVQQGLAVLVGDIAGATPGPAGYPFGTPWGKTAGRLSVDPSASVMAVVTPDGDQLYTASAGQDKPDLRLTATGLGRPQLDVDKTVWVNGVVDNKPVLYQLAGKEHVLLPLSGLDRMRVLACQVSPDLTRVGLVVDDGQAKSFGFARLHGTDQLCCDGWMAVPLYSTRGRLTDVRDIAWLGPTTILVLGASASDPHMSVYAVDLVGARVDSLGPLGDVNATRLATLPTQGGFVMSLLSASGQAMRYEDSSRWVSVGTSLSDICYAG